MKHLLAALASQTIPVKTDEHALKKLLADVHKHRGEVKASETWEEQLESALVELRGNEHAGPFLKPVKRTEAPDYDKVIKHPMDLQSMGKKVRQRFYTTKKQFSDDLYLIWENCLTYNSDPNHLLRRFARNMKTQTDHVLARIPDRRERTMESLIETFKFEPKPVPKPQIITSSSPPNVNHVPRQLVSDDSSPLAAPTPTPLTNGKTPHSGPLTEVSKASGDIIVPKQDRLKYRPTLERTAEGMSLFTSLDAEMDAYIAGLSTRGTLPSRSPSMVIDGSGIAHELLDHRLHTIIEADDELAMWKEVPVDGVAENTMLDGREEEESDLSDLEGELAEPGSKKRKRSTDRARAPRKRVKLEKVPQPPQPPIDSWWRAVRSTSLLSNGMPPSFDSHPILNPRYQEDVLASTTGSSLRREVTSSPTLAGSSPLIGANKSEKRGKKKSSKLKTAKQRNDLLKLIGDNNITRRRARALYGQVAEQIEEAKQATDPDEMVTTAPEPEPIPRLGKSWAQRASLGPRRQDRNIKTDIGPKEAQDAMEWMTMMVLEHANFDSSSTQAIQTLAGVAGEALLNLGRTLKILQEVQGRKMNAEEMILHALFSNGISSVYELEYYIKNDIVKNSLTLNSIESQLSETKKEEVAGEDALFDEEGDELIGGTWADYTGEDVMGLKDSGIAAEFGLVSLTVPRRLWKPKKVAAAKQSVDATEEVRYPPPPPFIPLQTKGIDKQIGLLRHYYQDRITKLALPAKVPTPPPPPLIQEPAPPTPVAKEPTPPPTVLAPVVPAFVFDPYNPSALAIGGSSAPAAAWSPPSSAPPPPVPVAEEAPQPAAPVVPMGPPPALGAVPGVPPPVPAPLELPPTLEDDLPDPARVKVGPLGQIQQISASAALKQKRAAAKLAATGGSAAAIAAGLGSVSSLPKPAAKPKPKKPKEPKELKESKTTPKKANKKASAAPPTPVAPTAS